MNFDMTQEDSKSERARRKRIVQSINFVYRRANIGSTSLMEETFLPRFFFTYILHILRRKYDDVNDNRLLSTVKKIHRSITNYDQTYKYK